MADALSARIATMTVREMSVVQDEAAMGELVPLLDALGRGEMQQSAAERNK